MVFFSKKVHKKGNRKFTSAKNCCPRQTIHDKRQISCYLIDVRYAKTKSTFCKNPPRFDYTKVHLPVQEFRLSPIRISKKTATVHSAIHKQ